ncbi:MAG: peptide chain release factor 1 [Clostridia bacterium]|nr:peptide chain release factor 1 [Clostridia bacterium]
MFDKLAAVENRYEQISVELSRPETAADTATFTKLMKEHGELTPIVEKYREYKTAVESEQEAKGLLDGGNLDKDFKELVEEEYETAKLNKSVFADELKILLLPKDPNDSKNVIVEIRGGAGGEEAALFAAELYRMYSMYAESKHFSTEITNLNETELGGYKEISFMIEGIGAYSKFKYESGVHRVQRVPDTETQGRIHTSTVTVAVLPEADEVEVDINPADLKIDTFRSSGAGGQHINKTSSAIRVTHIPSGTVVECQDERSQLKNKEKALKVLRARLYDVAKTEHDAAIASDRKTQVGTGDRSERIRTYNFPQGRVTDHRIGLTLYKLEDIMNGNIDEIVDALITYYRTKALENQENEG